MAEQDTNARIWGTASLLFVMGYAMGSGNWPSIRRFGRSLFEGLGALTMEHLREKDRQRFERSQAGRERIATGSGSAV